jgi:hypothetical protein
MKQILSKDSAIIITKKEVMTINHPTTIFTDDDVEVVTGKDEKSTKEALSETQIKAALTTAKVSYAKESKEDLIKKLDTYLNEKVIDSDLIDSKPIGIEPKKK